MQERKERKVTVTLNYEEGDKVRHVISGDKGVVIDWKAAGSAKDPMYLVSWATNFAEWFKDFEIEPEDSKSKGFLGLRRK